MKKIIMGMAVMAAGTVFANVTPAKIFSSNMVLQRDKVVPVWGTADAEEEVTVSFAGQVVKVKADTNGDWGAIFFY